MTCASRDFYGQQVSQCIDKTDLKQSKWKKSDLRNASDRTNSVVTHDLNDYDPGHWKFFFKKKKDFSVFKSIESLGFLSQMSKQVDS